MVSNWTLGGIFWWPTKSTPQLSVGSASKLMPRKVYPKVKLLFNLTTTVQVHYAYTDLASCFVLSWSCKSFWRGKKKKKKTNVSANWPLISKEARASSERNWEHADTNGPAGPALGLGYKWHIKQMVAHSRLVMRVNLPFNNFVKTSGCVSGSMLANNAAVAEWCRQPLANAWQRTTNSVSCMIELVVMHAYKKKNKRFRGHKTPLLFANAPCTYVW